MIALETANTAISDYLLFANISQLWIFSFIVLTAGIIRGCIGFGFSAIVVMSTGFWLPLASVVTLVVLLEVVASLTMYRSIKRDIKAYYLVPLCLGQLLTSSLGVWTLANIASSTVQWIVGIYMLLIATLSLTGFEYKGEINQKKLFGIGLIAGFLNGLAAVGGIFAAWSLVGLKSSGRTIRATMVVFFLASEVQFLVGAIVSDFITREVLFSVLYATLPLVIGVLIGSRLTDTFSDDALKKAVLVGLIVLSLIGFFKTLFWS